MTLRMNLVPEFRDANGAWQDAILRFTEVDTQDYDLFVILGGVPMPRPSRLKPICKPKGLPSDWEGAHWGLYHSWHTLDVLLAYPWPPNMFLWVSYLHQLRDTYVGSEVDGPSMIRIVVWFES